MKIHYFAIVFLLLPYFFCCWRIVFTILLIVLLLLYEDESDDLSVLLVFEFHLLSWSVWASITFPSCHLHHHHFFFLADSFPTIFKINVTIHVQFGAS